MEDRIQRVVDAISKQLTEQPTLGLILGSGLGDFADTFENAVRIPYDSLEGLPKSTVEGHKGQFVFGRVGNQYVMAMQGRFHFYEGYSMQEVTMPVRIMAKLGVTSLIVTNAAGGVNTGFVPGDLMVINDHINFVSTNPLIGKNLESFGPRFPDTSSAYYKPYINIAHQAAKNLGMTLREGVYFYFSGPNYETPAEIRMARFLGGDAVGMSTVPETMIACHSGLKVLGISCITNLAAGILDQPLNHKEVIETADRIKQDFMKLMHAIILEIEV